MEWNIGKNSKSCLSCDIDFRDKDEFFSALYDDGDKFTRRDFCSNCWNDDNKQPVFSFWKSMVIERGEKPKSVIDTNIILDLFLKLEPETDDRSKINLRYVLALFLMRKKCIKLKSSQVEGENDTLVIYYPKEDRDIRLFKPKLTSDEIAQITYEVKILFNNPGIK